MSRDSVFCCFLFLGFCMVAVLLPGLAMASNSTIAVPDVNTALMEDAGTKILTAVGIFVAIAMAVRLFKRG